MDLHDPFMCVKILREYADRIPGDANFTPEFSIFDQQDSEDLLTDVASQFEGELEEAYERSFSEIKRWIGWVWRGRMSKHKSEGTDVRTLVNDLAETSLKEHIFRQSCYEYQVRLMSQNAMDFDDLLLHTVSLFSGVARGCRNVWLSVQACFSG